MSELHDDLQEILQHLRSEGLPFLMLRHRDFDSRMHEGDFDFLIDARYRSLFVRLITQMLVDRRRFFLLQNPLHPYSHKYTLRVFDTAANHFVTLEFWHEFIFRLGYRCGAFRWKDLACQIEASPEGHCFREEAATLLLLAHMGAKNKRLDSPLVPERLARHRARLARLAGTSPLARDVIDLVDSLEAGRIDVAVAGSSALALLARASGLKPRRAILRLQLRRFLVDYPRLLVRSLTRNSVAVVGPDGSGKSTLVAALIELSAPGSLQPRVFKRFFRNCLAYKILMRARAGRSREQRNVWDERVGGWLTLLSLPGYLWALLRARGRTLVLDRYFYDFLMVDVRRPRYRLASREPLRRWLLWLVPELGLILNPLADHASTARRRDALTASGFREYERQLLDLIARRPPAWFAHLPSSHNLEQCVDFAARAMQRANIGASLRSRPTEARGEPALFEA